MPGTQPAPRPAAALRLELDMAKRKSAADADRTAQSLAAAAAAAQAALERGADAGAAKVAQLTSEMSAMRTAHEEDLAALVGPR